MNQDPDDMEVVYSLPSTEDTASGTHSVKFVEDNRESLVTLHSDKEDWDNTGLSYAHSDEEMDTEGARAHTHTHTHRVQNYFLYSRYILSRGTR